MIPISFETYEIPEYKQFVVPNKVVEYIEYLEKQEAYILKRRIAKAIEYIEHIPTQPVIRVFKKELLEILKGDNNAL